MRVAIFRPEPQASRMAGRLREKGVEAVIAPMLVVKSVDDPVTGILAGIAPTALLITSQNGVHALSRDPRLGEILHLPIVAVGSATAEAARLAGFTAVEDARGDGTAAVHLIETRFGPTGGRIVWVAGSERSEPLDERLRQFGFTVDVVIAYHAEAQNRLDSDMITALMEERIDVAVIASARTAESLQAALTAAGLVGRMGATRLVALSEVAARPLAGSFSRVDIAERTDGDALIDAVMRSGMRDFVREDAGDMSSENEPKASTSESGRRKPKAPIIDLTADDVTPAQPAAVVSETVEPAEGAPVASGAGGSATESDAVASSVDPEATASDAAAAPPATDVPVVASSETSAGVASDTDPSPGIEPASAQEPPVEALPDTPATAAETPPPAPVPQPRRGFGGYLAAALLGGVVVLGGAYGALRGGYVSLTPETPTVDLAPIASELAAQKTAVEAARSEVGDVNGHLDSLAARIEKLEQAPAPAGDAAALAALKGDVETLSAVVAALPKTADGGADPGPLMAGLDDLKAEMAALSDETSKLKADLEKIAATPVAAAADLDDLKKSVSDLGSRVDALPAPVDPARLAALEAADAALSTKLADIPAFDPNRLDRLEQAARDLEARIAALDAGLKSTLDTLSTRTGEIEKRLDAGPRGGEIAAVSLGLAALTSKLQAGEPFAGELAVVKAAAPDAAELTALEALATTGAPTAPALIGSLPIDRILAARPASTSGGVLDALFSGAQSLVNYRETGDIVEDAAYKALDGIEKALRAGDFAAAEAAAAGLPDWGQQAAGDWLARLTSRAAAETALAQLSTRILDRLKAPAEGQ